MSPHHCFFIPMKTISNGRRKAGNLRLDLYGLRWVWVTISNSMRLSILTIVPSYLLQCVSIWFRWYNYRVYVCCDRIRIQRCEYNFMADDFIFDYQYRLLVFIIFLDICGLEIFGILIFSQFNRSMAVSPIFLVDEPAFSPQR